MYSIYLNTDVIQIAYIFESISDRSLIALFNSILSHLIRYHEYLALR